MTDRIEAMERLGHLLDEGKISAEEYEALKREVLGVHISDSSTQNPTSTDPDGLPVRSDQYEAALVGELEIGRPGWFPDPERLGTHVRFHDGEAWTPSIRPRKQPGWYADPERPNTHLRYFDGLEYTYEYRGNPSAPVSRRHAIFQLRPSTPPRNWKFWVGMILTLLGGSALVATLYQYAQEATQSGGVLLFMLVTHPLIWGGAIGAYLLLRWRRES